MEEIKLSIIIPAYNEEKRIPLFLKELISFSEQKLSNYEILIVNDGSVDNTRMVVQKIIKPCKHAKIISYEINMGKGHAVYQAVLKSKGDFIIFIDADGATPPIEILKMFEIYRKYKFEIIVGNRVSEKSNIINPQPFIRKLMSKIFNLYSNLLFRLYMMDILCGFKGFERQAALLIFKGLKSFRWEFDVEILYKAQKKGYKIHQLPIKWKHMEGSKIKKIDPLLIFLNLITLRLKLI